MLKKIKLKDIKKKQLNKILKRARINQSEVSDVVASILKKVKQKGDKAFSTTYPLQVTQDEVECAFAKVDNSFLQALKQAITNINLVAEAQKKNLIEPPTETSSGVFVYRLWRPIEKVGIYIPGGNANYPSSVLMTAILAKVAGCQEIIICTPPNKDGKVPAPTLVAATLVGISKIYKLGGAEAIGAMAFGTRTVPKVYKIFGAGGIYSTEAKKQVFGEVAIDMPAGPSEVFIIADQSANPAYVAADLIADCEHGPDSAGVLVTESERVADEVCREIKQQVKSLSTKDRIIRSLKSYGLIATVESIKEAIDFANNYAPEHLELITKNPEKLLPLVTNAGSVFLGIWSTKATGDYVTGANHILPTGGMVKMFNPLSIESFGRKIEVQKVTSRKALQGIKDTAEVLAEVEGLPAHKASVSIRFNTAERKVK